MRGSSVTKALFLFSIILITLNAASDPDFSGNWVLDQAASDVGSLGQVERSLAIAQGGGGISCSSATTRWSYALDGSETRKRVGADTRSSVVKWEGAALLINTLVSGPQSNYAVMDRWRLSRDGNTLTIRRQIDRAGHESEGLIVYRRDGAVTPPAAAPGQPPDAPASGPQPPRLREPSRPTLGRPSPLEESAPTPALPTGFARRPEPAVLPDITVTVGTRVLLTLVSEVSTKRARDGDRVYLRTATPVAVAGSVVIPRESDVAGSITHTKKAGKVSGKGELFIRFDSLTLPNGTSRDFHARPPGEEGSIPGNGKSADAGMVMAGAGMGATVGAITRGLSGAAVGGAAGALAGVLLSRNQDIVLRSGTHLEMVLDRDLVFHPDELRGIR